MVAQTSVLLDGKQLHFAKSEIFLKVPEKVLPLQK